jgi:DNA processing protein
MATHAPPTKQHHAAAARQVQAGSDEYPVALRGLGEDFAPATLWMRGVVPAGPAVAVVGARHASAIGLVAARVIGSGLAAEGRLVVSGGAAGVDGAAHRGAIDAGGATVVVLGTGIDIAYPPRHAPLFDDAVAAGGAVLSQFPLGTPPSRWSFPRRNAVIAALSDVVVVVEAGGNSGALHTAAAAEELGRRVVVMTGSPGCDRLAAAGAAFGRDASDVLAVALGEAQSARPVPLPADPRALRLYHALDGTPRDLGELASRAGLLAAEAMSLAIDLELGGHAARAAGGRYLRLG